MRRLIAVVLGIMIGGCLGLVLMSRLFGMPKPKVKLPDARYSGPSISTDTVKLVQGYTVLIANEDIDERWRGTGVLLDSMTVLTCAHVVPKDRPTDTLWIYPFPGDRVVHAKLKFINYSNDLALLELTTPVTGHVNPVIAGTAMIGEPMISVGNIKGYMIWFVSYGIISGEHSRWVLSDAMIRGGNSGGPWANTKGEIVALTDVGWEEDDGSAISGGIPAEAIQKFMAKSKLKKPDVVYALTGE